MTRIEVPSSSEHLPLQRAVEDAERGIAEGNWVEGSDVIERLKRWSVSGQVGRGGDTLPPVRRR